MVAEASPDAWNKRPREEVDPETGDPARGARSTIASRELVGSRRSRSSARTS